MRMLLPLGSWARSSICLLFVLQVVRSNTFEAVRRGEEEFRDGSVDLEARNLNDVTPEPGPGVVPLVRNVGSGFRPKGEGGGEDGPEESPGLEKYLTWTLPPGPSTTAIIVATDLEEPTPTPTVNRREYQETGGIYFAERDGYVERRQQPQDDQLQPVLLAPVDPLVRIPGNVPDQVNAASPTPSPRPSSSTVSAQATTSPEVHAAPAIIRLPGTAPIAEAPSPPPSAPSPSVIPSVEMSRLRRNLKEGESELDLEEREVELDDREVELDEREVGLTEGSAPIVRMPSGNIIPAFAMSINATSTSTSITTRGNNGVVKREEGSSSENDSDGPESSPVPTEKADPESLKPVPADAVHLESPPSPILRDDGANPAMIVSRRSQTINRGLDLSCGGTWHLISQNADAAFRASRAGATFEVLALSATVITTFSAFVLSIRQSLKFDAKKSGNPKLARWSVSNGIVVLHMITRSLQFSVVALMAMGPDPFIEFLVSSFTSPSENYFGISVALVIFYAVTHTLLISNLAPKIVTTWVGKNILKISALVVSFVGSAAIIPTLTVLFQTITCHYGGNGDSIRHPSEEFCSSPCWTSEHWTTSLLAFGFVLFGISMFISTANTWQSVDAQVDIKSRHWFNTVVTAATVTTSIANVWLRSSPFALSLFMSLLSFFLATLTFAYKPINVVPASQLAGYTFLVPGITGIIGVLANTFDAEKALWVILLVIGWASVAIAAFSFSLFGAGIFVAPSMRSANQRAFTFEMETGPSNGLHDRIMAAISSQKKKGTKSPIGSPIGSATVGDKDKDSKEKSLTPMEALPSKPRAAFFDYVSGSSLFSRNRLEAMTADFFERKLIVWAETGVISEATAFCIADAMERNDPYLQLIYDRIIVCGIADTNDSRLLQAVKFAAESKLLLSAEITAAPFTQPAAKASTISSSGKDERKPLLLGREESHSQVLGGEDMI